MLRNSAGLHLVEADFGAPGGLRLVLTQAGPSHRAV